MKISIDEDFSLVKGEESFRVEPIPAHPQNNIADRTTSPVDPVILDYFRRQPPALSYRIYSNTDQTRHFHILPTAVADSRMSFALVLKTIWKYSLL